MKKVAFIVVLVAVIVGIVFGGVSISSAAPKPTPTPTACDTLIAKIDALEAKITALDGNVTNLQTDVTSIKGNVSVIQGALDGLQTTDNAINGKVDGIGSNLTALDAKVRGIQGNVSIIRSQVQSLYVSSETLTRMDWIRASFQSACTNVPQYPNPKGQDYNGEIRHVSLSLYFWDLRRFTVGGNTSIKVMAGIGSDPNWYTVARWDATDERVDGGATIDFNASAWYIEVLNQNDPPSSCFILYMDYSATITWVISPQSS